MKEKIKRFFKAWWPVLLIVGFTVYLFKAWNINPSELNREIIEESLTEFFRTMKEIWWLWLPIILGIIARIFYKKMYGKDLK